MNHPGLFSNPDFCCMISAHTFNSLIHLPGMKARHFFFLGIGSGQPKAEVSGRVKRVGWGG